jgi:hypothetical protein
MLAPVLQLLTPRNIAYHPGVRKLFAILLIVLLPLRGWTADHMATTDLPIASHSVVTSAIRMSPDCAMRMAAPDAATPHKPAHQGCNACQLCMPLATLSSIAVHWPLSSPVTAPRERFAAFSSAAPEQGIKPPIL